MSKFLVDGSARHKQTLAQMYQALPWLRKEAFAAWSQAQQPKSRLEECVDSTAGRLREEWWLFGTKGCKV